MTDREKALVLALDRALDLDFDLVLALDRALVLDLGRALGALGTRERKGEDE